MNHPHDTALSAPVHTRWQPVDTIVVLVLGASAAIWHAMLMTRATNDNFLHLTFAQQWLHGDWPVRDFYDQGWVLQYSLSAVAHLLFGDRLAGEAVIVGMSWAISTVLIYGIVQRLTAARPLAVASALLPIVASARGYSYPKGIVYAVAAALWWRYIERPTTARVVALGTWIAVAFYWRPDHGVYVAAGVTLAVVAAHGISRVALSQCAIAAATCIAWIIPFLIYVQLAYGLVPYITTGLVQAEVEHQTHGSHEWPLWRYRSTLLAFEPAERYAPIVGVRWNPDSSDEERRAVRERYGLTVVGVEGDGLERVRLAESSIPQVRALINEELIDDTAGIDRSAGTLTERAWPASQRRKFSYPLLRLQVLPDLDPQTSASEFTAAFFFGFPAGLLVAAGWISRRLWGPSPRVFALFAVFALLVAWAMIRNPFPARVADAVVLSSIAFGCCLGALWRASGGRAVRTAIARGSAVAVAVGMATTVAAAGRFESPATWVRRGAEAYRELTATPPLAFYVDRPARFSLRLAAYIRDCVPAQDRLLVLWFEPEIYYFSERLMAQRHAVFAPAWSGLEHEQRATLNKFQQSAPPLALVQQSALDAYARATFPGIIDDVSREYVVAATIEESGERYLVYARRNRKVIRTFGPQVWPCYTSAPSRWERVGIPR